MEPNSNLGWENMYSHRFILKYFSKQGCGAHYSGL